MEEAKGHVWSCEAETEKEVRELERKYQISSRQYTEQGIRVRVISEERREKWQDRRRQLWRRQLWRTDICI